MIPRQTSNIQTELKKQILICHKTVITLAINQKSDENLREVKVLMQSAKS